MAWIQEAGWHIKLAKYPMIEGEFSASIILSPPDKRKIDLDGRIKAVLDLAQAHQLIENDSFCQYLTVFYGPKESTPGVTLVLNHWEEKTEI